MLFEVATCSSICSSWPSKNLAKPTLFDCSFNGTTLVVQKIGTGWCPPVINWFINPSNYSYKYHKP